MKKNHSLVTAIQNDKVNNHRAVHKFSRFNNGNTISSLMTICLAAY